MWCFLSPFGSPYPVCTRFICHVLCASPHKRRVCVVLHFPSAPIPSSHTFYLSCFVCFASQTPGLCSALISLRLPYPVCTRFICHVLCASPHKRRVCVVLLISLRLPYPVCTRFYLSCFVSFASQTPGLYSVFNFPSAPLPTLHTFLFVMFVCFASQTPGLCSPFNLPSAPLPSLHTFYLSCFVCFASLSQVLCSASLFSSPALHSSLFILLVCFAPETVQFYFPWDFCSIMRLLAFTVNL